MSDIKDKLADLLQRQCAVIEAMDAIVNAQLAAVAADDLDKVEELDSELSQHHQHLEELQQETETMEQELAVAYADIGKERRAEELSSVLDLRNRRTEQLTRHVEMQQEFCVALAKYMDNLTQEGRGLNQTVQAFHSYRRAAQMGPSLLNIRK